MKPKEGSPRQPASGKVSGRYGEAMWNSRLPMEWMDPMSWRLPSGKALAEFALQSGFLAPLVMGGPAIRKKKPARKQPVTPADGWREGPDASGTFRETR